MRKHSAFVFVVIATLLVFACAKKDTTPTSQTPGTATTSAYAQPGVGQQGTAPATGYPQTGAQPAATATAAPGTMATPGPLAFPCTNDSTCGTHHCNVPAGKCAFPCQSDTDCIINTHCVAGVGICAMKAPGQ